MPTVVAITTYPLQLMGSPIFRNIPLVKVFFDDIVFLFPATQVSQAPKKKL